MMFVDEQVRDECWNLYDSYGAICVHCGCCSKDPKVRYSGRVACIKAWLEEQEAFDRWDDDPELMKIQKLNRRKNIDRLKRQLRYYSKKLMEVTNGKGEVSA